MQIQFTDNSPLDWSAGEGVQIFSDEITEDVKVVAVPPHPMSSPELHALVICLDIAALCAPAEGKGVLRGPWQQNLSRTRKSVMVLILRIF